jgi:hypothetical protein
MILGLVAMVVLVCAQIGCESKPRLGVYNLRVSPDASLQEGGRMPRLEVDLVGLNETQLQQWRAYSVDAYFSGADPLRAGAKEHTVTLTFSADAPGQQVVARNHPIWNVWRQRGVTTLIVLASSRSIRPSAGGAEPRRLELPLTTNRWKVDSIDITVKSSGVECPTPMEPVK